MDVVVLSYVVRAPYFWLSMGMTSTVAIFVGAIIYDGELSNAIKGLLSIGLYAFFVLQVDFTRLMNLFSQSSLRDTTRYAGILTVLFVTVFWVLGIILGVSASYLVRLYLHRRRKGI